MNRHPRQMVLGVGGPAPAMTGPVGPVGFAPVPPPMGIGGMGGMMPMECPPTVAPLRQIVHPTKTQVKRRVTKYPIENIYPSHTHHVHHHVCEYYCSYPHTESHQDCYHTMDYCCPPPRRRRFC